MYEHGVALTIGGREFNLVFTLAAFLEIKKKYGGLSQMAEAFDGPTINEWDADEVKAEKAIAREKAQSNSVEELPWLLATLATQGEWIKDPKAERVTAEWIAIHIFPREIKRVMSAVNESIKEGSHTETEPVDEADPVLEEIDKKNAEGAEGK